MSSPKTQFTDDVKDASDFSGRQPEVPVTPTPGADSSESLGAQASYFPSVDNPVTRVRAAQTPGTRAAGEDAQERKDSLTDVDPKTAFPSLSLTGSVISATFCVPYALQFTGSEWVSNQPVGAHISHKLTTLGLQPAPRHVSVVRFSSISII